MVLYLESVSIIRSERASDVELLELCSSGAARSSSKMRDACLRAQADRAAPVFFKAAMRALHNAWTEFVESCGSPFRLLLAALFVLSVMAPPVLAWMRVIIGSVLQGDDDMEDCSYEDDDGCTYRTDGSSHYIVLDHEGRDAARRPRRSIGFRSRVRKVLPRLMHQTRQGAFLEEDERVRELEAQKFRPLECSPSPIELGAWRTITLRGKDHAE
jgi:hypothetical protein